MEYCIGKYCDNQDAGQSKVKCYTTYMNKYIQIRRQGASLYLRLPASFVHENGLNAGDWIFWEPENFKLIKQTTMESAIEPARVPETAAE